jgi:DNA-binding NarL/FixJ family response regulator
MTDPIGDPRIRVAIADDQELIRSAVSAMIEAHDDLDLVLEASDGAELLDSLRAHRIDVVLMDIRMPRLDGIAATERLIAAHPATRVLVLTTYDLDEYVFAAIRAGASGFLTKDASSDELAAAIREVHAGDAVIAPRATASLIDFVARVPEPPDTEALLARFTPRERDVLMALLTGASNDVIGERLHLTGNTVKTHLKSILGKLALPDRVHVVIWGFEHGLAGVDHPHALIADAFRSHGNEPPPSLV